ncbi:MAG: gliding motility protein GldB [Dysgonamonadaceae bacterium]|jgi:hypothetical protein|nr:gliding motility protein GldB [Dysgonamonadaceae bacterium]
MYSESTTDLQIIRFDEYLYHYLTQNNNDKIPDEYKSFLNAYGEKVIYIGKPDSLGFQERLRAFFSDPTLMTLYCDEQSAFSDISEINAELSQGMEILLSNFPHFKQPKIYMHVSGLNQNVIVTDEILSLSADKYLGTNYPVYQDFFYEYQRQLMSPDRIVPDYLLGFMMANLPFEGNDGILLERMLYEGKLRYLLSQFIPDREVWEYVGYNKEQYTWCTTYQSKIWKSILENQHLFHPDYMTTSQYLKEAPYTASLPVESPGRAGIWLGYQIIVSYMKNHPETGMQELMNLTDYKELLKLSKYKP